MKPDNNNWLDDSLTKAIGSEAVKPDFEKWQKDHPQAVEMLTSRAIKKPSVSRPPNLWSIIMKSRITKLAAAAAIIIAVTFGLNTVLNKSVAPVYAAEQILADAAKAVSNLRSVYIKAQMRTVAHDNFELIGLDYDFVPIEMWKEFDGTFHGKWRVEKPQRVVVMDGQSSLMLMKQKFASKGGVSKGYVLWLKPLLDVDKVLDSELKLAQEQDSELLLTHKQDEYGKDKLVVTVETPAQGNFTNDWCKNKSIIQSDNQRVYTFDAETKLLESLKVYVHAEKKDVLVFEITEIQYNIDIEPELFTLELPKDVIWFEDPKPIENDRYANMSPKEIAQAFWQAASEEKWDEFAILLSQSDVPANWKNYFGGLEILNIGQPFKSGLYPGWFVPYEIKFKSGHTKKMNLAVRYSEKAKRFYVDGGF